jgi:release factor glutamine methyltransferase
VSAGYSIAGQTIEAVRRGLASRFNAEGINSAELDARMLVGAVLNLDLTGLITAAARRVTATEAAQITDFARRRIDGEPVARILGHKEFWGLKLRLSPETLVPRPDTETVVEVALAILRAAPVSDTRLRIADIGTGSGAILLALLHELPEAFGVGTDVSIAALRTARLNAADLQLAARAAFVSCDYAAALSGPFDLIVSNPPYVRSKDIADLASEVRDHDPHRALDGGADGLDAYRVLVPQAARLLGPGGALVVEAGRGQSSDIEGLMKAAGFTPQGPPRADLAGVLRGIAARKLPS